MAEVGTTIDTMPLPRRFWWLKRILVAAIALELAAVGMRYLSLAVAKRRLAGEVAALQARGQAILPQDFVDLPASQEQNAAIDLLRATKLMSIPVGDKTWDSLSRSPPWPPAQAATIDAVLAQNREALAAVRRARHKPVANWGLDFKSPVMTVTLPMVNDMRQLSEVLYFAARRSAAQGHTAEALEYLRDMQTISRSIESQPFLVSQLVASAVSDIASNTAIAIAPGISDDGAKSARAMIDELLEDREKPRSGWRWAFEGERMMQLDVMVVMAGAVEIPGQNIGESFDQPLSWWMRPIILADAPQLLRVTGMDVEAAGAPDYTTAASKLAPSSSGTIHKWWDLRMMRPQAWSRALLRHYQTIYLRRQAAITLAQRLFRLEQGRPPWKVEELSPKYLERVPLDPLAGDGSTMSLIRSKQPVRGLGNN